MKIKDVLPRNENKSIESPSLHNTQGELINEGYAPVNKGHYELEPPERVNEFKRKLSKGWRSEYNNYRKLWEELPQRKVISNYPLLVDLELASKCNLTCPMCPTTTAEFNEKRVLPFASGLMDYELIKKIIDEVVGKIYSLRLSWIGEPTLHPRLVDSIRYAKDRNIPEVSFLTNGTKLNLRYMKELIDAGLDLLTISIDGLGETYNKIRKPLRFDKTIKKLTDLKHYKDTNQLNKPVIKIQGIWPAIKENPTLFYNTLEPLVDLIAFNPLIDYLHNDTNIVYEEHFYCPQPYQRVVIGANGKASMCSSDDFMDIDVGDANTQSIYEIWHGDKLKRIREQHLKENGFMALKPCKNCFYPRKMEASETTIINGRKVIIENYINRAQIIGK